MDKETYITIQLQIIAIAGIVRDLPLAEFIKGLDLADRLGFVSDQAMWLEAKQDLGKVKRLAEILLTFQTEAGG